MKEFIGDCVGNPFNSLRKLEEVIDGGKRLAKKRFLAECDVPDDIRKPMREYPNDYKFYCSLNGIYFYTWSGIEHFYN